ncbi:MAG TPA: PqqD family protein [Clostridia bacterium]|nr:PqqD family protein [Clostridiaceae bacterium]HOA32374.1 PqqD family protein [Clostridia bacterium]HPZ52903.1 PqqD family protein [Clostridia bacterium]
MKIKDGYMLREIDGVSVVVAVGEESKRFNGMIRLNSTGTFLWKHLSEGIEYDDLLDKMLAAYEVDEQTARQGIDSFITKLKDNGFLSDEKN